MIGLKHLTSEAAVHQFLVAPVALVQAKLTEIATVIEKSESLDDFLNLFPSSFELRGLLSSEADPSAKKKLPKSIG